MPQVRPPLGSEEADPGSFEYHGEPAADVSLLRLGLLEHGAQAQRIGQMTDQKPVREGAIAPLRHERQAFLDAFMPHAAEYMYFQADFGFRVRLRKLLSDAWYDGYIHGERHADSQRLLTDLQTGPKA